jgi:hypothetical protein
MNTVRRVLILLSLIGGIVFATATHSEGEGENGSYTLNLGDLPPELIVHVLNFLVQEDPQSLGRVSRVSKGWYRFLNEEAKALETAKASLRIDELITILRSLEPPVDSQRVIEVHNQFLRLFGVRIEKEIVYGQPSFSVLNAYYDPSKEQVSRNMMCHLNRKIEQFYQAVIEKLPSVQNKINGVFDRFGPVAVLHHILRSSFLRETNFLSLMDYTNAVILDDKPNERFPGLLRFRIEAETREILCPLVQSLPESLLPCMKDFMAILQKKAPDYTLAKYCINDILEEAIYHRDIEGCDSGYGDKSVERRMRNANSLLEAGLLSTEEWQEVRCRLQFEQESSVRRGWWCLQICRWCQCYFCRCTHSTCAW